MKWLVSVAFASSKLYGLYGQGRRYGWIWQTDAPRPLQSARGAAAPRCLADLESKIDRLLRQANAGSLDAQDAARQLRQLKSDLDGVQRLVRLIASSLAHG